MIHSYSVGMPGLMTYQVPFPLSFLASMSREIDKDIEDMAGDMARGAIWRWWRWLISSFCYR